MAAVDDLLDYIFEGKGTAFYLEFEGWLRGSRRFRTFADGYRSKLRAKVKNVRDEAGMADLRAELATAALLLREERFSVEYEKYAALKQRGPDFTVTFKTHTSFNVEVRRFRGLELDATEPDLSTGKLMAVLCDKVGQMPPSIVNLLWLIPEDALSAADVSRAALALRDLAERKGEEFFTRRGFESAAHFLKQFRRLSAIVLPQPGENGLWLNALARHKVPPEIVTAIQRLGTS